MSEWRRKSVKVLNISIRAVMENGREVGRLGGETG